MAIAGRASEDSSSLSSTTSPATDTSTPSTTSTSAEDSSSSTSTAIASTSTPVSTDMTDNSTLTTTSSDTDSSSADLSSLLGNSSDVSTASVEGATYIDIQDISGAFVLAYDGRDNFLLQSTASALGQYPFTVEDGIVLGGDGDDVMFYYPDEMRALGVSRFRLGDLGAVPKTSEMIVLAPFSADGEDVFLPVAATSGDLFSMVFCTYAGGLSSKVFLVNDVSAGIATLMTTEAEYVVTGGVIDTCTPFALASTLPGITA